VYHWKLSIGALLMAALSAQATPFTVSNTNDSGAGSLRFALSHLAVGTLATTNTINFTLPPSSTILVGSTLPISQGVTITGPGAASLAIDGGHTVQIFTIASGITVSISGLTIQNGSNDSGDFSGGGIDNFGTLTVTDCTVKGNAASHLGAGIYNNNGATLTIMGCTISNNVAGDDGAVGNDGMLTVMNSTLSNNTAFDGAAIENNFNGTGSTLIVTNSTFFNNGASDDGGAIDNDQHGASLMVSNSTFYQNSATREGGAIEFETGTGTVTNSTFFQNSSGYGGAIQLGSSSVTIINGTFSGNTAGAPSDGAALSSTSLTRLSLKNTILANGGTAGNCGLSSGITTSYGHNLSDDASCSSVLTATSDQNGVPAGLDPSGLHDNGGPTNTIAILSTSLALNAIPVSPTNYCTLIDGVTAIATDQRGVARPQGPACDIGAYEYVTPPTITKSFGAPPVYQGKGTTLEIDLANQSSTTMLSNVAFSDPLPGGMMVVGAPITNTCGAGVTASGGSISLTGGTLAAGGSCQIIVMVTTPNAGSFTNTTSTLTSDLAQPGAAVSVPITITPAPLSPVLSKVFSNAAIQLGSSSRLTFTISNPGTTTTLTGITFTDTLPAGLAITAPNGLLNGCAGAIVTAVAGTNFIQVSGVSLTPGASCVISLNVTGVAVGVKNNVTSGIGSDQTGNGAAASATIAVGDIFQISYVANLTAGDSSVNLTNAGWLGGDDPAGDICADVYVFAPDQQLVACCACPLTPNHIGTLSAHGDLMNNLLTPGAPNSLTVALVASTDCNPATVTPASMVEGLRAWRTTLHSLPGGKYGDTETEFTGATLSASELIKMTELCGFIESNGSGFGICNSCKSGAAGGSRK
jgi:uncharacterized repeat protein (TIGR01451 family)